MNEKYNYLQAGESEPAFAEKERLKARFQDLKQDAAWKSRSHEPPERDLIQAKVCMVGAFAVGKTSLVNRFVHEQFEEPYHTTVGVMIDKKVVSMEHENVDMRLWDIHGEDAFQKVNMSYLRGSSGLIMVADGTRATTIDKAMAMWREAEKAIGRVPAVLAVNKSDLKYDWDVEDHVLNELRDQGCEVVVTSARDGRGVEELFSAIAGRMVEPHS